MSGRPAQPFPRKTRQVCATPGRRRLVPLSCGSATFISSVPLVLWAEFVSILVGVGSGMQRGAVRLAEGAVTLRTHCASMLSIKAFPSAAAGRN